MTPEPSADPTQQPTSPSSQPTGLATNPPIAHAPNRRSKLSVHPSRLPTGQSTFIPTDAPGETMFSPSGQPTSQPTWQPTSQPSCQPTSQPSSTPSIAPSGRLPSNVSVKLVESSNSGVLYGSVFAVILSCSLLLFYCYRLRRKYDDDRMLAFVGSLLDEGDVSLIIGGKGTSI